MDVINQFGFHNKEDSFPKTSAARVLPPLLDALNWQGNRNKILEAMTENEAIMSTDGLLETLANLQFKYEHSNTFSKGDLDPEILPALIVNKNNHWVVLNVENDGFLVFDGMDGIYTTKNINEFSGEIYVFQYAEDMTDSLIHQQKNWFNKLLYRFKSSIRSVIILSFLITCLDLAIPILVVLIYDQIASQGTIEALITTYFGVLLYIGSSYGLGLMRSKILNYISTRMGSVISTQTFKRLLYLSPSYTETASINSQINRIKDFENLKRFITSDVFIDLLELIFSMIYVGAIFYLGGWLGVIPIITLIVVVFMGLLMKPFHRIKMEQHSDHAGKRQQNVIEILKNAEEIKSTGLQDQWIKRNKNLSSNSILKSYELSDYVNISRSLSYFITNASVLAIVYGGVVRILGGHMSMGMLIGIILLYWKVLSSIRGAFNLAVQVSGIQKSIAQINRFMNLPQDTNLKSSMESTKEVKGHVRFADVSLKYSKTSNPALLKVNFETGPGQIMGITGHDGAGKTTILKLILGMYKPQGGRILLDKNNIKQLEPLSLRKSVSYAPDKDVIFSGTIRENFQYYNAQITDKQILEKAQRTGLSKYLDSLELTLDYVMTEKSIAKASLSFKKLFNITRAICRDVNLFLIDEPENYLRPDELEQVIGTLRTIATNDKASIIITTKNDYVLGLCDQELKLNQGRTVSPKKSK